MKQFSESWRKFSEWFLTGQISKELDRSDLTETEAFRRQMKEQIELLESRRLPIQIVHFV